MPYITIGPNNAYQVFVDEIDVDLVKSHAWYFTGRYVKRQQVYPKRLWDEKGKTRETFYLHREIVKPEEGLVVDHIDNNGLNNSRNNLRACTHADNLKNRDAVGVTWDNQKGKWKAGCQANNVRHFIGYFEDFNEGVKAYRDYTKKLYGEFAYDYERLKPNV
jgi:hypothetical protein